MRKLICIISALSLLALLASCTKSPEEKADAMIKEKLQKSLYHPESYEPTETKLDSAFAPFDDPVFYEKTVQMAKLGMAITQYDEEAKSEKSSMAIWEDPYMTSLGRNEYQEAKEKYDQAIANKNTATEQAKVLGNELKAIMEKGKVFIGFKAKHSYRANNNNGQTIGGNMTFLFDKEMTKIVASYDMDNAEYDAVQYLYKIMRGENTMGDGMSFGLFEGSNIEEKTF